MERNGAERNGKEKKRKERSGAYIHISLVKVHIIYGFVWVGEECVRGVLWEGMVIKITKWREKKTFWRRERA